MIENLKEEVYALLVGGGCTIEEHNGITYVKTPAGYVWDFTIPQLSRCAFLNLGERVRAKTRVFDLPDTSNPGPVHAEAGELGTVEHTEPGCWPTVRFDRTGTATCVTDEEVEKIDEV